MTLTMTSKGQFTLPAEVRKDIGLKETGDTLILEYDPGIKRGTFWKVESLEEISQRLTAKIKPGIKPLVNVSEYYQQHRGEVIR